MTNIITTILGIAGFCASFYFGKDWQYLLTGCCISILLIVYKSKVGGFLKSKIDKIIK